MKLFKKLVAVVAMAAVCLAMAAPVSASAANLALKKCPPHNYKPVNPERTYISSQPRQFTYFLDIDDDGYDELVVDVCQEVTYELVFDLLCAGCGMGMANQYGGLETTHSEVKCPEASVG